MRLIPRITSPRMDWDNGVNFGKEGVVLVIKGNLRLVWQPGSSYWSGLSGNQYSPSGMSLRGLPGYRDGLDIYRKGGRLSKALVVSLAEAIDKHFGEGVAAAINPKMTLMIEPEQQEQQ